MTSTSSADRVVSASKLISASAETIFELLADPSRHREFDGSGSVVSGPDTNPKRLSLGARFGMSMKLGLPYKMTSEVVEFSEGRQIAWRHFGHHVWRYELEPKDGGTLVTESFDWGVARIPSKFYELVDYPGKNKANMIKTLDRLAAVVEVDQP